MDICESQSPIGCRKLDLCVDQRKATYPYWKFPSNSPALFNRERWNKGWIHSQTEASKSKHQGNSSNFKKQPDLSSPTFHIFKNHKKKMNDPKKSKFTLISVEMPQSAMVQGFSLFSHCCQPGLDRQGPRYSPLLLFHLVVKVYFANRWGLTRIQLTVP